MEKNLNSTIANLAKYWQENKPTSTSPLIEKNVEHLNTLFDSIGTINVPSPDHMISLLVEEKYDDIRKLYKEYTIELEEWACTIRLNFSELSKIMEFLCCSGLDTNSFDDMMNNVVIEIEKIIPELDERLKNYKKAYFDVLDFAIYKKFEKPVIIKDEDDW